MGNIKQVAANNSKDHLIPENEKSYVHAIIHKAEYDVTTGKAKFKPFLVKKLVPDWNAFLDHPHGFVVVEIIHRPSGAKVPDKLKAEVKKKEEAQAKAQKKEEANRRDMRGGDKDAHQKKSDAEGADIDEQEKIQAKVRQDEADEFVKAENKAKDEAQKKLNAEKEVEQKKVNKG
jgi:hypothetical protein